MTSTRGAIPVIVLYVVGALGLSQLVPNWRVSHLFAKGPGTEQLAKAQADLAKALADAAAAKQAYEQALAAQRQATVDQLRFSQQFAAGIPPLLEKAPQTPEVTLARSFAGRVNRGLSLAIGDLPPDKQEQIMVIIEEALSQKQAEVEAAQAKIAQLDGELAATTKAKVVLEAQLPALQLAKDGLEAKVVAQTATVAEKTAQVVQYADKAAAKEKEAGSLSALLEKVLWVVGIAVVLAAVAYYVAHFMLPSLAVEFPQKLWLGKLNQAVRSIASAHE